MRILMLTPQVDRHGWVTGFIHTWIDHLARHPRVDHLDVICLEMGEYDLPPNVTVTSMGKERGYNRLRELITYQRTLIPALRRADIVFGHMIPRFTLFAAPWAKLFGKPIVQWYTHRHITRELRIVHTLADRVVTASAESFRLESDKVTVLGHGIDTNTFHPPASPPTAPLIVSVGRLSPIKHYETLIDAAALLVKDPRYADLQVAIAGGVTPEHGQPYADTLRQQAADRGVADHIQFLGPVPHRDIPDLYRRASVAVNLCPTGGVDKAVIEGLSSGVPVVVTNHTFLPILGAMSDDLFCETLDPVVVAEKLAAILDLPTNAHKELSALARQSIMDGYALDGFMDRLVAVFEQVIAERSS